MPSFFDIKSKDCPKLKDKHCQHRIPIGANSARDVFGTFFQISPYSEFLIVSKIVWDSCFTCLGGGYAPDYGGPTKTSMKESEMFGPNMLQL